MEAVAIDHPVPPGFSSTINRAEIYVRSDLDADSSKESLRSFGRSRVRTLAHELLHAHGPRARRPGRQSRVHHASQSLGNGPRASIFTRWTAPRCRRFTAGSNPVTEFMPSTPNWKTGMPGPFTSGRPKGPKATAFSVSGCKTACRSRGPWARRRSSTWRKIPALGGTALGTAGLSADARRRGRRGNAGMTVDLSTLSGYAEFYEPGTLASDAPPGAIGTGTVWVTATWRTRSALRVTSLRNWALTRVWLPARFSAAHTKPWGGPSAEATWAPRLAAHGKRC